jgi:hypothetical protein
MSWLTSVVIAKCVTAYQDDNTPSKSERMITGAACCAQNLIARTTKLVIILMVAGALR